MTQTGWDWVILKYLKAFLFAQPQLPSSAEDSSGEKLSQTFTPREPEQNACHSQTSKDLAIEVSTLSLLHRWENRQNKAMGKGHYFTEIVKEFGSGN